MSDQNEQDAGKSRLSLRPGGRLELGKTVDAGSVRQSFSHGRSKTVQVEVVKKRAAPPPPKPGVSAAVARAAAAAAAPAAGRMVDTVEHRLDVELVALPGADLCFGVQV